MNSFMKIYRKLFDSYGPQGWWPLLSVDGTNPTKTGAVQGYHPGDYTYPKDEQQQFEICVGAILTQNTSWTSVEKALINLNKSNALNLKGIKRLSDGKIRERIKVSGYYNQKAKYLKEFIKFYESLQGKVPSREALLEVKGIGPETADSMLLFAFKTKSFIVDSYTKRLFLKLGIIDKKMNYDEIQRFIEESIDDDLTVYQEYHALLVEHAKRFPKGEIDPIISQFKGTSSS